VIYIENILLGILHPLGSRLNLNLKYIIMRKILIVPCLFLLLILANSCSGDDDQVAIETPSLVGKWSGVDYRIEYFNDGEKEEEEFTENDENDISTVTFKSDGTFSTYQYEVNTLSNSSQPEVFEETLTGTYSTEGDKLLLSFNEQENDEGTFSSTFTLSDDKLIIQTTTEYSDFVGPQSTIVTSNLERTK